MKRWIHASADLRENKKYKLTSDNGYLLYSIDDDSILLNTLRVDKEAREQGIGSELIEQLKDISNKSNKPIKLFAIPIEDNQMTDEELIDWYESKGFEYAGVGFRNQLIYYPRKE